MILHRIWINGTEFKWTREAVSLHESRASVEIATAITVCQTVLSAISDQNAAYQIPVLFDHLRGAADH